MSLGRGWSVGQRNPFLGDRRDGGIPFLGTGSMFAITLFTHCSLYHVHQVLGVNSLTHSGSPSASAFVFSKEQPGSSSGMWGYSQPRDLIHSFHDVLFCEHLVNIFQMKRVLC